MANYFVINNKFRPYSFDELIKPYQMYGEEYRRQEAALDAAREKEFSADLLDAQQDKAAYDMYNAASQGLQAVSDELATKGLSTELRGKLRSTARDYKRTMDALNEAQSRLYAEQDRRAKLGSDYVFQQDNLRIGDFLNGRTPNQKGQSLNNITKDIAAEFSARAQTITNDTWNKAIGSNGKVIGGYYDVTTETGLKQAQLDTILSDEATWNSVMQNPNISRAEKQQLQGFRNSILAKKQAIGYDSYSPDNQLAIEGAIRTGASAGLGTTTHKYQQDHSYNPLGWANYNLSRDKFKLEQAEAESPYTHSDESNPTAANRTGLKPGYTIKNGKLQYNPEGQAATKEKTGTNYTITTPGVTVYTPKEGVNTYTSWDKVREGDKKGRVKNTTHVAIEDITDPDIKRELLSRINVPNVNVKDADLDFLIDQYMPQLNQLTVQIGGEKGTKDYVWVISDKKVQRLTGDNTESEIVTEDDKTL